MESYVGYGFRTTLSHVDQISVHSPAVKCTSARTNERLVHCLKRSQTRLPTLSISLQHTELLMRVALDGYSGGFRIGGRLINNLRYAGDIVLIASSEEELQKLVSRVHGAAKDAGMKINVRKTEVMKVCENAPPNGEWRKYLGSLLAQIPWSEVQCRSTM